MFFLDCGRGLCGFVGGVPWKKRNPKVSENDRETCVFSSPPPRFDLLEFSRHDDCGTLVPVHRGCCAAQDSSFQKIHVHRKSGQISN